MNTQHNVHKVSQGSIMQILNDNERINLQLQHTHTPFYLVMLLEFKPMVLG